MARAMRPMAEEDEDDKPTALVVFRLGTEEFGAPIGQVREIVRLQGVTRVPRSGPEVEGVMNLRGQILTVVDLRKRLGFDKRPENIEPRVMVVNLPSATNVGIVVDDVADVMRVPKSAIQPPPQLSDSDPSQRYLSGLANLDDRLILLVDLSRLLKPSDAATEAPADG